MKNPKQKPAARNVRDEMMDFYRANPDSNTRADLIAAGFTGAEIDQHAASVAEMVRADAFAKAA